MDGIYVFVCGLLWLRYRDQEAGDELLRASNSSNRTVRCLAWAMLLEGESVADDSDGERFANSPLDEAGLAIQGTRGEA